MIDKTKVVEKLKAFIEEEHEITIEGADSPLDIDSFMMMMVITFTNVELGVKLDPGNIDFNAFTSLDTLADLIIKANREKE